MIFGTDSDTGPIDIHSPSVSERFEAAPQGNHGNVD